MLQFLTKMPAGNTISVAVFVIGVCVGMLTGAVVFIRDCDDDPRVRW